MTASAPVLLSLLVRALGDGRPGDVPKVETLLMYDCEAGNANWERGWSEEKIDWCCAHQKTGCRRPQVTTKPYDCAAGLANWEAGWSSAKKEWCCRHEGHGCALPSPRTSWPIGVGPDGETISTTPWRFSCEAEYANYVTGRAVWPKERHEWCCKHKNVGCPFKCDGDAAARKAWSAPLKAWCCKYKDVGCQAEGAAARPAADGAPAELVTDLAEDRLLIRDGSSGAVQEPTDAMQEPRPALSGEEKKIVGGVVGGALGAVTVGLLGGLLPKLATTTEITSEVSSATQTLTSVTTTTFLRVSGGASNSTVAAPPPPAMADVAPPQSSGLARWWPALLALLPLLAVGLFFAFKRRAGCDAASDREGSERLERSEPSTPGSPGSPSSPFPLCKMPSLTGASVRSVAIAPGPISGGAPAGGSTMAHSSSAGEKSFVLPAAGGPGFPEFSRPRATLPSRQASAASQRVQVGQTQVQYVRGVQGASVASAPGGDGGVPVPAASQERPASQP